VADDEPGLPALFSSADEDRAVAVEERDAGAAAIGQILGHGRLVFSSVSGLRRSPQGSRRNLLRQGDRLISCAPPIAGAAFRA
jgi:hypothetical protein